LRRIVLAVWVVEELPWGRPFRTAVFQAVPARFDRRRLFLPSLPFIVVYRVLHHAVEIVDVIHRAQPWPPSV
jgi:hypothetical protein